MLSHVRHLGGGAAEATGRTTRISILGPLLLIGPAGTAQLTAHRQQVVLATLLWNANHIVPLELLIRALWADSPPETARSQVHIIVSAIRKRLARCRLHQLVETRPPGYLARVSADELDLQVFDDLVLRARRLATADRIEEANSCLIEALRMWRGEPFPGVDNERVRWIAAQLSERWVNVCEEYFELQIRRDRSADVIGDLTMLVEQNPFRERLRGQLMIALCRAGRQVEALREYRDTRTLFVSELGMEPGPRLRELECQILSGAAGRSAVPGLSVVAPDN